MAALLRSRALRTPDAPLLRFGPDRLTAAEVDLRTDRLARGLAAAGVGAGDRVGISLPNGLGFPLVWLAVAKAGAVAVPLNPGLGPQDRAHLLADSEPRLVVDEQVLSGLEHAGAPPAEAARPGLLSLQYTSGTTGLPKACMLTHDYWLRLGATAVEMAALGQDDVLLTAAPFHYIDPQWNLVAAITAGAELVVLPRFSASTFWDAVAASGATFTYLVGTMPLLLERQPERPVERAHRLRLVVCSGISSDRHAVWEQRYGVPWREAYGMTESGVDLCVPVDDTSCVGSGRLGTPVPGKQVRVVDGELQVRGAPMMAGYWRREESPFTDDGWLRTGDLVADDGDGLRLVGRIKDMVRRGGENIAAAEVEAALLTHPAVTAAAVVAVADDVRGEEVKAFVVPARALDPADVVAHVRELLAPFKVPRYVELVDELPMTPSERVAKHALVHRPDRTFDALAGAAR